MPVSIVPLDASAALPLTRELMWETGGVGAGTGADLVSQLYLRNPGFATEGQSLWDSLTALLLGEPALAAWEDVRLTLTTSGEAAGRLARSEEGRPVRVARSVDPGLAIERWLAALTRTAVPLSPNGSGALRLNGPAPAAGSPAATR